jgi:hypothetical protein
MTIVENGIITHVAMPFTIYVKVIFVSLLFYFVDSIIDLKNKIKKKQTNKNKTTQLEQFHNPNIAHKKRGKI